jgi:hypothetical protein
VVVSETVRSRRPPEVAGNPTRGPSFIAIRPALPSRNDHPQQSRENDQGRSAQSQTARSREYGDRRSGKIRRFWIFPGRSLQEDSREQSTRWLSNAVWLPGCCCKSVAALGRPQSALIFRRRRRGASLFDKFNANSAIFCPNELRPSSHVAVPCHNQEKILRGHPRIDQTKQMNPRAAGRNIFQTAFYRPRSIAPYNHGVERSIKADPLLGPLVSGHLRSRSVRRRPGRTHSTSATASTRS